MARAGSPIPCLARPRAGALPEELTIPVVTFEEFGGGLDVRPAAALSRANILRRLKNAYVTTGKSIKKRPCCEFVATLESGTVGLKAFAGKLTTFYGAGSAITHADTRFVAKRVPHITTGAAPTKIHYFDQYAGLAYIAAEYGDGTFRHHYLDDPGAWSAGATIAANAFRRPTVANGFRYEATAGGGGTTGGSEPTWPTTVNATVVDNAITWTCRTFAVTDTNCPHTKQVAKQAQKIFAASGDDVRYCKTGDPRDWTTSSDAGFIPTGKEAKGSQTVTAIGPFQKSGLWVAFSDNCQVWTVDSDPSNMAIVDAIEGIGTIFHRAAAPVSGDLFFPAQNGFRSVSLVAVTDNLQDRDVGSPIDDLVQPDLESTDDPQSLYYPKLGQWWCINGTTVWAYSFSRTVKLSAWSQYELPFTIDDACVLNQDLYVRTGNDVYKFSASVYKDGTSSIPLVDVIMFYQDGRKPGVLKQFTGQDIIGTGNWTVSHKFFSESGTELESDGYELPAISEPGAMNPVELLATRIAPHLQHQKDEAAELSMLSLFYESLGPM